MEMDHSNHVSEGFYGTEFMGTITTSPQDFLNEVKERRLLKEETYPILLNYLDAKSVSIQAELDYYNKRKGTSFTLEQLKDIASGWSLDDMDPLLSLVKRDRCKDLTLELLDY